MRQKQYPKFYNIQLQVYTEGSSNLTINQLSQTINSQSPSWNVGSCYRIQMGFVLCHRVHVMWLYPSQRQPTVWEAISSWHKSTVAAHTIISPRNVAILSNIHPMRWPDDRERQPWVVQLHLWVTLSHRALWAHHSPPLHTGTNRVETKMLKLHKLAPDGDWLGCGHPHSSIRALMHYTMIYIGSSMPQV